MPHLPVIIPVETKSREFHGKLFLALHLLERGHPVLFGEQSRLWELCDLVEPGIYVEKSVAATHMAWIRRCRGMGHTVVSWDEEGLVFFDPWQYRKLRFTSESLENIERFFAWGEIQCEAICEEYPQYRDKIVLCGNPRFDFLRPDLRDFYQRDQEALKRRFGNMLLVNTNFAFHNHFKSPEEVRRMLTHYPLSEEPGYMDKWISMHREMHQAYLKMVPEVLARYPEHTVVLRPHPSENHGPWLELAKSHPRLHVDSSGNVHAWILASEAVIHFNCTTAVEAFLLGIPGIAYRPARYPRYENHLPNALSENVFSMPELFAALDGRATASARGALWTEAQKQTAARYMTGLTGKTAARRISEEIIRLAEGLPQKPFNGKQRLLPGLKRIWRGGLHRLRETRQPADGYAAQKFPGIADLEIHETLSRMMEISRLRVPYRMSRFAKHCYWLRPAGRQSQ